MHLLLICCKCKLKYCILSFVTCIVSKLIYHTGYQAVPISNTVLSALSHPLTRRVKILRFETCRDGAESDRTGEYEVTLRLDALI